MEDMKFIKTLLSISTGALLVSGAIFLYLSITSNSNDTNYLTYALGAIVLGNLFNVIRVQLTKQ